MLTNALCDGLASSQTRSHSRGSCPIHKLLDSLIACVTTRTTRTKTQPTTGMILHARTRCTINPSSWSQLVISIHSPNRRHHLLSYFATASQLTMHSCYSRIRGMTARYPACRGPGGFLLPKSSRAGTRRHQMSPECIFYFICLGVSSVISDRSDYLFNRCIPRFLFTPTYWSIEQPRLTPLCSDVQKICAPVRQRKVVVLRDVIPAI